jgi:hypothetical protein
MTWVSAEYQAQHVAVYKAFGCAKDYLCIDCNGAACDWSFDHDGNRWNINDYWPRCRRCHLLYDSEAHKPTDETKRKIAASVTGSRHTDEAKAKMSEQRQGSKHCNSKLTEADVIQIRELANGQYGQYPILAERFGVSVVSIKKIVYRKTWTHV